MAASVIKEELQISDLKAALLTERSLRVVDAGGRAAFIRHFTSA